MNEKELEITAHLARLSLDSEKKKQMADSVSRMIEFFEHMDKADVDDLPATTHPLFEQNRVRPDCINSNKEQRELLEDQAPVFDNGFIVIPKVL